MINDDNRPYSFALNIVEADRLFTPAGLRGNKNIREGVELGERGEPIAYYIRKTHPGDILYTNARAIEYIRYPAMNIYGMPNIMHLYWQKRPGQTRGEPFFAPVLALFKDLTDYIEAELIAEKIAACFAGFITKSDPYIAGMNRSKEVAGKRIEEIYPGMFEYLAPGEDIKFANPSRPSGTFEPFVERILRAIGVGLGMPYELIAKDFSKTNYSSARAALLEAWRFFKVEQDWLGNKFNQPVWERLLLEAFLREEITAPNFLENRLEWTRARWIAPGRGWVDPVKEVQASLKAVEGNISTLADECASNGKDWEETLEQIARENKKKQSLGLPVGVGIDIQGEAPQETPKIKKEVQYAICERAFSKIERPEGF
ncbi:MAG: hypothetical protein DDT31_01816 [Syntrophomonadaceae bacterium]|nr:hypothetical protein [Bacillota bacterium]